MKQLDKLITASCKNHSDLIRAGIPPEQALRIAFGDEMAEKAIKIVNQITKGETK